MENSTRTIRHGAMLFGAFLYVTSSSPAPGQSCIGDCNGDGAVSINELILGVNDALNLRPVSQCAAQFDEDGSGSVEINELISAVNNALVGCPTPATETTPFFCSNKRKTIFSPYMVGRLDILISTNFFPTLILERPS